eukprot:scaffold6589_cov116-Isochrysis_galbana.AAC.8
MVGFDPSRQLHWVESRVDLRGSCAKEVDKTGLRVIPYNPLTVPLGELTVSPCVWLPCTPKQGPRCSARNAKDKGHFGNPEADPRQWLQHFGESVQVAAGKAFKCLRPEVLPSSVRPCAAG